MLAAEMLTLHILSALQTGVFIMFSHPHAPDAQVCAYGWRLCGCMGSGEHVGVVVASAATRCVIRLS